MNSVLKKMIRESIMETLIKELGLDANAAAIAASIAIDTYGPKSKEAKDSDEAYLDALGNENRAKTKETIAREIDAAKRANLNWDAKIKLRQNASIKEIDNDGGFQPGEEIHICPGCKSPSRGNSCDNPGCFENPRVSSKTKMEWKARMEKDVAAQAERDMIHRARNASYGYNNESPSQINEEEHIFDKGNLIGPDGKRIYGRDMTLSQIYAYNAEQKRRNELPYNSEEIFEKPPKQKESVSW